MATRKWQLQTLVENSESFQEVIVQQHGSTTVVIRQDGEIGGFSEVALKKGRQRVNQLKAVLAAGGSLNRLHEAIVEGGPINPEMVACLLLSEIEVLEALAQRRNAGRKPKPPRRSPLRQAIIEAMGPLRAEEMTFHAAMLSLAHSPVGALRVRKEGDCWRCENEDEDWPPELLTRDQLQELFKAAR